jgi:hypothetical protein
MIKVLVSTIALAGLSELANHFIIQPYLKPRLPEVPDFSPKVKQGSKDSVVDKAESLGFI